MPESPYYHNALPLDSMLLEYRLESVLGAGGFGITYLGWDTNLEKHVAIKEYLPGDLAVRALDGSVVPVSTDKEYTYQWGLNRFIQEARTLAKFSHPNIVRVNRFLEANGTSYMVMDYEAGESLYQYLRRTTMPDEATLRGILLPILDGLQAVHKAGFLHRDIKPSNVFIRDNGIPVLLDFGSARLAADGVSKSMTAIVSPGFAPPEQYSNDGNQGPWSDVYALAAVLYRAITGENPFDAVKRMKSDGVPRALSAARTRYSERFLKAVEWGMTLDEGLRPQTVAEWRELFSGRVQMTALNRAAPAGTARSAAPSATDAARVRNSDIRGRRAEPAAAQRSSAARTRSEGRGKWLVAGSIVVVIIALAAIFAIYHRTRKAESLNGGGQVAAPVATLVTSAKAPPGTSASALPAQEGTADAAALQPAAPAPTDQAAAVILGDSADTRRRLDDTPAAKEPAGDVDYLKLLAARKEFEAADRDSNGYLTRDEVRNRFPFIEKSFAEVDRDGDGRISADEFVQLRRKQQALKSSR